MNILVTGSAGYIGSHATARLLREGHRVIGVDNLFRGHTAAMDRCAAIGREAGKGGELEFHVGDTGDVELLTRLLRDRKVDGVMHFAALAYVGESVTDPLWYYRNNTVATVGLLQAMQSAGTERLVFSSSCSTYGDISAEMVPVVESCKQDPISPYGRTKLQCEQVMEDYAEARRMAGKRFAWRALRYFNVAGCDTSGVLGEDHTPESHLVPLVLLAALGKRDAITIFGTDYPTPDGTCIRDYIHVEDLADAHAHVMAALQPDVPASPPPPAIARPAYNLGNGRGYSVREIIEASRHVTGRTINVKEGARRPGDPPKIFADPSKIRRELGWTARITDLHEIIASAWRWMQANPEGYPKR